MSVRWITRLGVIGALAAPMLAVAPAQAQPTRTAASDLPTQVAQAVATNTQKTITYAGGGEYTAAVDNGARIWNERVPNIRLVRSTSGRADITVQATTGGGSRATLGRGYGQIWIDRNDVRQGNSVNRIASHEMGHTLGLRDNYNGVCSELMSGGSAGTSCTNPYPNAREASTVNSYFAGQIAERPATAKLEIVHDIW